MLLNVWHLFPASIIYGLNQNHSCFWQPKLFRTQNTMLLMLLLTEDKTVITRLYAVKSYMINIFM